MLCQNCGKNPATTHIKTIVNGKLTEYDLCSECAREMGYNNFFKEMDFGFGNLLGGFIGAPAVKGKRCAARNAARRLRRSPKAARSAAWNATGFSTTGCCRRFTASTARRSTRANSRTAALRIVEPAGKIAVVETSPLDKSARS